MSEPNHNPDKRTILIVDDSPELLSYLGEILSDDYNTQVASCGALALELVERAPPDLILLDVVMPDMDGYETCRKLRDSAAGATPVIFLSALTSLDERVQGYVAGGDDYICKPVELPELMVKIQKQLAVVAKRRDLGQQLDEAVGMVLSSADMAGEIGVVLEFQRQLSTCNDYTRLSINIFDALERYGLDGCLRIQGRMGVSSRNNKGDCSTLESSILDHLATQSPDPRIQPFGQHTSFNFGSILLFIRDLPMYRPPDMDSERADRCGRHIDNVALLLEGACTRVITLDNEEARIDLNITVTNMMSMTKVALADISARNQAQSGEVLQLFENLASDVESSFMSLGLLPRQEELLRDLVQSYMVEVMKTLAKSKATEAALGAVIAQLC
ncbi:MAG: response regulator [Aquabacterium sp.]|nr:response regulator [Aquabacterium sp.]